MSDSQTPVAIVTTTINIPHALKLYRKFYPNVPIYVTGDKKTPEATSAFCATLDNCQYLSPDAQDSLYPELSTLLGWNTIARRNIAILQALKHGAELIYTIDDDNLPLQPPTTILSKPFPKTHSGLQLSAPPNGWFDPGWFTGTVQRGYPQTGLDSYKEPFIAPVTDVRVGIYQGAILGDPDTSAIDRISKAPNIHIAGELLRAGVTFDPTSGWAPVNTQNTAFIRELAPCFLLLPQFGRYDDIYAGLVAQRFMRDLDLVIHFGQPFAWQQRNAHNLLRDLAAEQWGAENILRFAGFLEGSDWRTKGDAVSLEVVRMYARMRDTGIVTDAVAELAYAWHEACEAVMK